MSVIDLNLIFINLLLKVVILSHKIQRRLWLWIESKKNICFVSFIIIHYRSGLIIVVAVLEGGMGGSNPSTRPMGQWGDQIDHYRSRLNLQNAIWLLFAIFRKFSWGAHIRPTGNADPFGTFFVSELASN